MENGVNSSDSRWGGTCITCIFWYPPPREGNRPPTTSGHHLAMSQTCLSSWNSSSPGSLKDLPRAGPWDPTEIKQKKKWQTPVSSAKKLITFYYHHLFTKQIPTTKIPFEQERVLNVTKLPAPSITFRKAGKPRPCNGIGSMETPDWKGDLWN